MEAIPIYDGNNGFIRPPLPTSGLGFDPAPVIGLRPGTAGVPDNTDGPGVAGINWNLNTDINEAKQAQEEADEAIA